MRAREAMERAVRRLSEEHLRGYVEGYEAGTLEVGCTDCAVGHMLAHEHDGMHGRAYQAHSEKVREVDVAIFDMTPELIRAAPLWPVEVYFEGIWSLFPTSDPLYETTDAERVRHIYDACVMELARRAGQRTAEQAPEREAVAEWQ